MMTIEEIEAKWEEVVREDMQNGFYTNGSESLNFANEYMPILIKTVKILQTDNLVLSMKVLEKEFIDKNNLGI